MPFQKTDLEFKDLRLLPELVSDYLSGSDKVKPFYEAYPDENGFRTVIENRKKFPPDRKLLVEVLLEQNPNSHATAKNNISLLENEKTFTVITGHQLNLFTGPLYFIYKILSVIKLSIWLNEKFPGNKFIPVYWMASEDHDIAEIIHTYIHGKKIEWKSSGVGAAGRIACDGIDLVIEELKTLTDDSTLLSILSESYQKNATLSDATRILVDALFGKYGLVIVDPDDAKLKRQFIPHVKEELIHQISFTKTNESITSLEKLNYEIQVRPREINLFYLHENSRERIVKEGQVYKVLNTQKSWNENEILSELEKNPERFSPNVVLRPLYQETVFPNVGYVGGPAEIAYWLEYKNMFNHFKCSFPVLVLRNSAMLADETSSKKMEKFKISETDLFKSLDVLSREFIKNSSEAFSLAEEANMINKAFDSIYRKAETIDPTISKSVAGEKQKQQNAIKSLEERILRAEKKKHEQSLSQIQKLKQKFFPEGILQERHENFISFYMEYGESFFDDLLEAFEAVSLKFHFLRMSVQRNNFE